MHDLQSHEGDVIEPVRPEGSEPAKLSKRGQVTRQGKPRLLTRNSLDGRTITARVWDARAAAIHADLAGRDQLSAIELSLVEAFVGASVVLDHLNTRVLAGAEIDNALVSAHAATVSAMVRVGSRLGLQRRPRDVTSLGDILRQGQQS